MLPARATRPEINAYLDHLASAGFDGAWISVVPFYWSGGVTMQNREGQSFGRGDPAQGFPDAFADPNPAWLDWIEFILDEAANRGLEIGMVVAWGADFSGARPGIPPHAPPPWDDWLDHSGLPDDSSPAYPDTNSKPYKYGKLLAQRWASHPGVGAWVMGGDYMEGHTEYLSRPTWSHVVRGLRDHGATQPSTYQTGGFESSWYNFAGEWWQDFLSPHLGHCNNENQVRQFVEDLGNAYPNKRIISSESRYEAELARWCQSPPSGWEGIPGPEHVAADAQAVLDGGGHGVVFGHNSRWNWNGELPNRINPLDSLGSGGEQLVLAIAGALPGNQAPVAEANGGYAAQEGESVSLSSSGSFDPDGSITSYRWDFGDGSSSPDPNPTHTYPAGSYTATLTVTDDGGATDTDTATVDINAAPIAEANGAYAAAEGETVALSSAGSFDPDGSLTGYVWDLGDGASTSDPDPTHTYQSAGSYTATLTVTDNAGASHTDTATVVVNPIQGTLSDLVALVQPNGRWHLRNADGTIYTFFYGIAGDVPLLGDWNGDGIDTPGMYRPTNGFAYLTNVLPPDGGFGVGDSELTFFIGRSGDQVLVGDWDGDGVDTLGVRRGGKVFLSNINSTAIAEIEFYFGWAEDVAFGGDPDGDGIDNVFLYRPSTGLVYYAGDPPADPDGIAPTEATLFFGVPSDKFVVGDWNGNGLDTVGVYRAPEVLLKDSNVTGPADRSYTFGESGWRPVAGFWG